MKKLLTLVAAVALCSSMVFAQGLGLKGVGGSIGYTSVSNTVQSTGGFAIGAHVDLGEISPSFQLVPELQYWSTSKDNGGYSYKISDFAVNANVRYNIAMEGNIKPYAGGGLGLNMLSFTAPQPTVTYVGFIPTYTLTDVSTSYTRIGINLLAGANYGLSSMTIAPEIRYVLASDFNHFMFKVGVMVPLGK